MKKVFALLLALVMVLSLTACGAPTDGGDSGEEATGAEVEENVVPEEPSTPEATFAEVANSGLVLVDDDQCKITITGVEEGYRRWTWNSYDGDYIAEGNDGFALFFSVENKRADKVIGVDCGEVAFNGLSVMHSELFEEADRDVNDDEKVFYGDTEELAPGEIRDFEMCVCSLAPNHEEDLIAPGMRVGDVSVISGYFEIWEVDENENVDTMRAFFFDLYRDSKETATYYERTPHDSDMVLYEDETVTVTAVSNFETGFEDELVLFIENKEDGQSFTQYIFRDQCMNGEAVQADGTRFDDGCCFVIKGTSAYTGIRPLYNDGTGVPFGDINTWDIVLRFYADGWVEVPISLTGADLQQLYGA